MTCKALSILFLIASIAHGCNAFPDNLEAETASEAERYLGTRYEVNILDHRFERNLSHVSATYIRNGNHNTLLLNRGYDISTEKWKRIEMYAHFVKKAGRSEFDSGDVNKVEQELPADKGIAMNQQAITDENTEKKFITPCPKTPNCVSSVDTSRGHFIQPLEFNGSARDAQYRLLRILNSFKGARVVTFEDNFIEAEFVSSIFRFVDDVKFYLDDRKNIIHVKSSSRVGFSDLGVNRRRVEKIRKQLEQNDQFS